VSPSNDLFVGLRLRVANEVPFEKWYLRPRADVDLGYALRLQVIAQNVTLTLDGASKTDVKLTPALEVGARFDVGSGNACAPTWSPGRLS
jgi:hypothetical protein